jgi:catechol 2,3-dioxygenase-like lactoylglutathione lyase family enzyme
MTQHADLNRFDLMAFVIVRDVDRARAFYRDVLGLRLLNEQLPFALIFDANGVVLRVAIDPDCAPARGTVLGWRVPDIVAAVQDLVAAGVKLERFSFMKQDDKGVWTSPSGSRVAWFKDPDGNVLSVSQHPDQFS